MHEEHLRQELMEEIQETGVDPGWINNGGLFIANNKERMEEYRRLYTMGKVLGIESHLLSPEETKVDITSTSTIIVTVKVIVSGLKVHRTKVQLASFHTCCSI